MSLDPALDALLRLALCGLFLAAGLHKLRDAAGFRAVLADYRLLPDGGVALGARALPVLELALAGALWLPATGRAAPLALAALLALYSGAIAINLGRGRRHIDCGCLGPHGRQVLGPGLLVRNALWGIAAGLILLPSDGRPLVWVDALTIAMGGGVIGLLHASSGALLAGQPLLRQGRA